MTTMRIWILYNNQNALHVVCGFTMGLTGVVVIRPVRFNTCAKLHRKTLKHNNLPGACALLLFFFFLIMAQTDYDCHKACQALVFIEKWLIDLIHQEWLANSQKQLLLWSEAGLCLLTQFGDLIVDVWLKKKKKTVPLRCCGTFLLPAYSRRLWLHSRHAHKTLSRISPISETDRPTLNTHFC